MGTTQLRRIAVGLTSTASGKGICVNLCRYPQARKWVIELVIQGEAHAIPIDEAIDLYVKDGAPVGAVTMKDVIGFLGMMFD